MYTQVKQAYQALIENDEPVTVDDIIITSKCAPLASRSRSLGNAAYALHQYTEAKIFYTKSIAVAHPGSEELALAFGNRSAVLLRLEKFYECFLDLNRVLRGKYPKSLKSKFLARKKVCIEKMREKNRLNAVVLREIEKSFHSQTLFGAILVPALKQNLQKLKLEDRNNEPVNVHLPPPTVDSENKSLPGVSAKIEPRFNEEWGRHLVASEYIQPGEIIATEKAFASTFTGDIDEVRFTHCSFCYVKNDSLIPCDGCSLVMYCGDRCRQEAYTLYHRIECKVAQFPRSRYDSVDSLALRILLIGTEQGKELKNLMTDPNFRYLFGEGPPLINEFKHDYSSVCNLDVAYDQQPKVHTSLVPWRAATALYFLKKTSFFDDANDENDPENKRMSDLTEAELFTGNVLMNHFFVMWRNSFPIAEYEWDLGQFELRCKTIGTGLYCITSLINHSCDPNVISIHHKDRMIIVALRPITVGEQIFVCYAAPYYQSSKTTRIDLLRFCGFECQCKACEFDWPEYDNLPSVDSKCLSNDITSIINQIKDLKMNTTKNITSSIPRNRTSSSKDWLQAIIDCRTGLNGVNEPCKEVVDCEKELSLLMKTKGNFYLSNIKEYLKICSQTFSACRR